MWEEGVTEWYHSGFHSLWVVFSSHSLWVISDTTEWYQSMVHPFEWMGGMCLSCMHVGCICVCYVCMVVVIVTVVLSCRS